MSTAFASRLAAAAASEENVFKQLEAAGWRPFRFGQGLLSPEFRVALRDYRDEQQRQTLLRWFPDIVAFKRFVTATRIVLLDVKSDLGRRYDIEIKALEACEAFQESFFVPCWFVYEGLSVLTPEIVREHGFLGPQSERGSGTPYLLVEKVFAAKLSTFDKNWELVDGNNQGPSPR
jgi:hypothetical protein